MLITLEQMYLDIAFRNLTKASIISYERIWLLFSDYYGLCAFSSIKYFNTVN